MQPFKFLFYFTASDVKCRVTAVKRLPILTLASATWRNGIDSMGKYQSNMSCNAVKTKCLNQSTDNAGGLIVSENGPEREHKTVSFNP